MITIISVFIIPVAATTFPIYHDVYNDDGVSQPFTLEEQVEICQQNGKEWTGGIPYVAIRRVQAGGSYNVICNGAGMCISGLFERTPAQMTNDWNSNFRYYEIHAYADGGGSAYVTHHLNMTLGSAPAVNDLVNPVNFTGNPLDGYSPLSVNFTISNYTAMSTTLISKWSWGDGQQENVTSATATHIYSNPGIYTVSLNYYNTSGFEKTITKNNYVLTSNPSGLIVYLDIRDATSPNPFIQDSTGSIQNITSGVWRNVTAPSGKMYFSTTDPGYLYSLSQNQSIRLCANKTGYRDDCSLFNIPYNFYTAKLFLMPTNIVNATGAGTVVASVVHNTNGLTISGISIALDTGQMGITNSAGATTLFNVTSGLRYATATDTDGVYLPTKLAFNLTAGETKLVVIQMLRPGETPVVTPVAPGVTPTGTYDPNDPNSPVYGNYSTTQINEQGGAGVLGMLLQLGQLWPLVMVGLLMKFMKSAFS